MDTIRIRKLEIFANHGVFKEEKVLGQKFILDIELYLDTQEAALTEDLNKSIHYGILCSKVADNFKKQSFDLIETAAEDTAQFILESYPICSGVKVSVKKPWAPVMMHLETVEVVVERHWTKAFVSLGSNIGDRENYLKRAIETLKADRRIKDIRESKKYNTKAWGLEEQDDFLNEVISFRTTYTPSNLLRLLQKIELDLGRERKIHWGPRTIDLDILFYGNNIIQDENLKVPHPFIQDRDFVLTPMMDIDPFFIHPVLKKSVMMLHKELKERE